MAHTQTHIVYCVSVIKKSIFFLHSFIKYTCSEGIMLHTNTTASRHFFTKWLSILTFPHFPPLLIGPAFSCPANSTLANWCRKFMSRIFSRTPWILAFTVAIARAARACVNPFINDSCRAVVVGRGETAARAIQAARGWLLLTLASLSLLSAWASNRRVLMSCC